MPLHAQLQMLLDAAAANPDAKQTHEMTVSEARESYRALGGGFGPGPDVASVSDQRIPGPGGEVPIRVYTPRGSAPFPVLVFYHGGGFVIGDLDTHDKECRALCNGASCVVVSVDYRLAPEHPFPAAAEDAVAALRWVGANAATIEGDATRIAVGGDSAGGNLAAVVALDARDQGGPSLRFQLLVYPTVQFDPGGEMFASLKENAAGPFLLKETIAFFMEHYTGQHDAEALTRDPRISPLQAHSLAGLPPALVVTAEFDPLRDEGEAYAAALEDAGVPVDMHRYDGMAHAFFQLGPVVDDGRALLQEASEALRKAFG